MKNKIITPPLTDTSKPWGVVFFIHSDGTERSFSSCVNEMTGDRLSFFGSEPPSVGDSIEWVKSVFRDIRKKAKILRHGGPLSA